MTMMEDASGALEITTEQENVEREVLRFKVVHALTVGKMLGDEAAIPAKQALEDQMFKLMDMGFSYERVCQFVSAYTTHYQNAMVDENRVMFKDRSFQWRG